MPVPESFLGVMSSEDEVINVPSFEELQCTNVDTVTEYFVDLEAAVSTHNFSIYEDILLQERAYADLVLASSRRLPRWTYRIFTSTALKDYIVLL